MKAGTVLNAFGHDLLWSSQPKCSGLCFYDEEVEVWRVQ